MLVFATGSRAVRIPILNSDAAHVFRTIDDVKNMVSEVKRLQSTLGRAPRGIVVGGGLLGLEAAEGLKDLGAEPTILDVAPWLLSVEVDQGGGYAVNAQIKATGIEIETGVFISGINKDADGNVVPSPSQILPLRTLKSAPCPPTWWSLVPVFAPNDELARDADLALGERGGILVNDACHTSDEHIWAIGEVACVLGRTWGLVAPANAMADAVAANLLNGQRRSSG